jgi:5-methyltetrahydrofolate--homocysteine methyltransferase
MELRAWLQDEDRFLLFDGGMGTMLQERGLLPGDLPEDMNLTAPEMVREIHAAYVAAGADVITTNTFGANELKLPGEQQVEQVIAAAVACARASGARFVALDIGPLGQLLEPLGPLNFEQAYALFARQVRAGREAGADLIIIETMSDLYECKAAVLAAKEQSDLPVFASMTFQEDGRTFLGCDAITAAVTLSALRVDALGVNCSLGPAQLLPVVEDLLRYSRVPVLAQANAGLPNLISGKTAFSVTPGFYVRYALKMARRGVRILGGCCGTTPEYIALLRRGLNELHPVKPDYQPLTACTSGNRTAILGRGVTVVGERLNPTGKKRLQKALREGDMDYVITEAFAQAEAGSDVLDINVGLPELDEAAVLARVVREVQGAVNLPLQLDSPDPRAIEAALRVVNGKPIINSVNGKAEVLTAILPLARRFGAVVIGLTLDENGIPPRAEERVAIARRIAEAADRCGLPREDLIIDCLVLAASAQQTEVAETLRAVRLVKAELGLLTILGVSNVSFGLPYRPLLGSVFLAAALGAGLDACIINPLAPRFAEVIDAFRVLNAEDADSLHYIAKYAGVSETAGVPVTARPAAAAESANGLSLGEIIEKGRRGEAGAAVSELLLSTAPLDIVEQHFIPALDRVGQRFEKGELFLPQLMQAAQAVQNGFEVLRAQVEKTGEQQASRGKILLATVKGDIHDIGKNIVKMLLENYGFAVVDLGRDVPPELIVQTIREQDIRLAGLSALMTTTVESMKETIAAVRQAGLPCHFMVGGAVMSEKYAQLVGADFYARDAMESAAIAGRFFVGETPDKD